MLLGPLDVRRKERTSALRKQARGGSLKRELCALLRAAPLTSKVTSPVEFEMTGKSKGGRSAEI
jgi:hypothetical protein